MSADPGLIAWVSEALEPMGHVSMRRMMGGATLYLDGIVFAIVGDDRLWLKGDAVSDARWDAAGCAKFSYEMKGKMAVMNYRAAPDDVYDDADALREWCALALEAGLRGAAKKKPKARGTD
ncbi:TfoX/Sxy family protein [Sphingobium boeckii]|uniref:DNA transformation protein n=1 Tax=Sphingobium boeckii TaxID=1082345 RepID=A0A7W9ECY9_9SPHN|nr:TfoX/Sxy family protein [Sphingobium boeckii]MBB5684572.1 DNA transformation protein [Sphingobium boeckii]